MTKFTPPQNCKMRHNGSMLRNCIVKNRRVPAYVAGEMGVVPSTLLNYYKRSSLRAECLWRASLVLGYNFFFDLGMQLPRGMESALDTELSQRVEQLEKENERLKIEIAVYEKIFKQK